MSASITNRVYLPDGKTLYVSDDVHGDRRLEELYKEYGNLRVQACHKELGKSLDDLTAFWDGTIETFTVF